ncbi:MAG: DNA internalization-related competence protein ComEC/Rec2 [Eubacteriaceae bacterium]|nr:DNA internalization-related competence protein ComEC/Rec2 [Eubacteriaceae bacterium]
MKRIYGFLFLGSFIVVMAMTENSWLVAFTLIPAFGVIRLVFKPAKEFKYFIVIFVAFLVIVSVRTQMITDSGTTLVTGDESHEYTGKVISFPFIRGDNLQMVIRIYPPGGKTEKVQCYIDTESLNKKVRYGDMLHIKGAAYLPKGKRNPGGFDYRLYLKSLNIHTVIYAQGSTLKILGNNNPRFIDILASVREKMFHGMESSMETDNARFAKGVLFGERSLDEEEEELFSKAGISHILSVSGLHVAYIYGFILFVLSRFKISGLWKLLIVAALLLVYSFLSGFSVSVIRSAGMAMLHQWTVVLNRKYDTLNAMFFIGLVSMLINPLVIFTAAFILSYSAVFAIAAFYPVFNDRFKFRNRHMESFKSLLFLTAAVQLFTLPVLAYLFNTFSVSALFLNLIAVPVSGMLLIVLLAMMPIMLAFPEFSYQLMVIPEMMTKIIFSSTEIASQFSFYYLRVPAMRIPIAILFYGMLFMISGYFYLEYRKNRICTSAICTAVILWHLGGLAHWDTLTVTVIDVGQGDSILIEAPGDTDILIDGGGYVGRKVGDDVVKKVLMFKNISELDLVICTHSHFDHSLGLVEILDDIKIDQIMVNSLETEGYERLIKNSFEYGVEVFESVQGTNLEVWDGLTLEILYPFKDSTYEDANNSSVVARLVYKEVSFMFTGDIGMSVEGELTERYGNLKSDIIKIAHHGSGTSSLQEFIDAVDPSHAVISVGENNRYGHPADKTLEFLSERGIKYYRTDYAGAVELVTDGKKFEIKTYAEE